MGNPFHYGTGLVFLRNLICEFLAISGLYSLLVFDLFAFTYHNTAAGTHCLTPPRRRT